MSTMKNKPYVREYGTQAYFYSISDVHYEQLIEYISCIVPWNVVEYGENRGNLLPLNATI